MACPHLPSPDSGPCSLHEAACSTEAGTPSRPPIATLSTGGPGTLVSRIPGRPGPGLAEGWGSVRGTGRKGDIATALAGPDLAPLSSPHLAAGCVPLAEGVILSWRPQTRWGQATAGQGACTLSWERAVEPAHI